MKKSTLITALTVLCTLAQPMGFADAQQAGIAGPLQSDRLAGKCLDVRGDMTAFMNTCGSGATQQWSVTEIGNTPYYTIQSTALTNRCLGVAEAGLKRVFAARCQSVTNQQWRISPAKNPDRSTVANRRVGDKCLGIGETPTHDAVDVNVCHGYPGQSWQVPH